MKRFAKAHIINIAIWIAFFAAVLIRFDYSRSIKSFIAIAIWCVIVFIISFLLLFSLSRIKFSKKSCVLSVIILVAIDQVIKIPLFFSSTELSLTVVPGILKIFVILNKYQTLVLQAFDRFESPYIVALFKLMLLPLLSLLLLLLTKSKNHFSFRSESGYIGVVLLSSAIISTSLDSLLYKGTPDYFYFIPLYSSVDLKDIFAFLGASCLLSVVSTKRTQS